jgi:hypothetical protein
LSINPLQKRSNLRGILFFVGGERGGENIPVRFVDGEMQLFPAAPSTQAVLGLLPLSGPADFKASAVHQNAPLFSGPKPDNVVWSGMGMFKSSRWTRDSRRPSVCLSGRWYTDRIVSAVSMAKSA